MKKILLLGGSAQQVVAIKTAKNLGYYTVLCDYLLDNPGQYVSDKYYSVSTTDQEAVLKVAKKENIDGILAYASDPAAPTAAYVAETLNLPGNPYHSVEILCRKDLYRSFLKEHGFFTPEAKKYISIDEAISDCKNGEFQLPVLAKPIDSSGSKGVIRIDDMDELKKKLEYAMSNSKVGRIIIEEYIESSGYQIAGDGLSIDGKLVFRCFADDHFDEKCINPFVPISASFPCSQSDQVQDKVHVEIQRLLTLLQMGTCTYNFDIRIDKNGHIYLMEVAPRSGGNYIPQVIQYSTGVNLVECAVKAAVGENVNVSDLSKPDGFWSYYATHSLFDGILKRINIRRGVVERNIIESHLLRQSGDRVTAFTGANATLGCLLMRFSTMEEMLHMMDHSDEWIQVVLEEGNASNEL